MDAWTILVQVFGFKAQSKSFIITFSCLCLSGLWRSGTIIVYIQILRQVLFDIRVGNSNLAKSLIEISNHAMYQHENPHRCLLSLQNLQN